MKVNAMKKLAIALLLPGLLAAQPNPATSSGQGSTNTTGLTITVIERMEIQRVSGNSMQFLLDLSLRSDKKTDITSIGLNNFRVEDISVFPNTSQDAFTLQAKTPLRRSLTFNAPVSADMAKWLDKFGGRVRVDGTALINGQEPGMLGRNKSLNASVRFNDTPVLVRPTDGVLADFKKVAPPPPDPKNNTITTNGGGGNVNCNITPNDEACKDWRQKVRSQFQGRLVVLEATYTVEGALSRNTVVLYRQGFRMANGDIIAPFDLVDPSKQPNVSSSTIEGTVRDAWDKLMVLVGGGKPTGGSGSGSSGSSSSPEPKLVAWVPGATYSDRITLSNSSSYPVRMAKRLTLPSSGNNPSDLAVYRFNGGPSSPAGDFSLANSFSGYGESIHIRVEGLPQGPQSTTAAGTMTVQMSDLPGLRPNGSTIGLGTRVPTSAYGSIVANRNGQLVGIVTSEDGGVSAIAAAEAIDRTPENTGTRPEGGRETTTGGGTPPPPPADTFNFHVESTPLGAKVYVDDNLQLDAGKPCVTPCVLRLKKGTYKIMVDLPGYRSVTKNITVDEDDLTWSPTLRK
jgi:hypothetical protein